MELLHEIAGLARLRGPLHLAIGVFDGVHRGHQAVIGAARSAQDRSESRGDIVVVTFDPHPVRVLSPQNAPRLLTATTHKVQILERYLKIRNVLAVEFTREFAEQHGQTFIEDLVNASPDGGIGSIAVGKDWKFGKGRSGNVDLLRELGARHGFEVGGVDTVTVNGMTVSSTRIREAVAAGDFDVAEELLGRRYSVFGTVVEGRKLGRTIGFPTANLTVHSEQLPPTGVYAVRATGFGDGWDGVGNLGYRPTVEGGKVKRVLEVHLFGLDHEIYGEELEIEFVSFLRPETKFDGIEALKEQIGRDVDNARTCLSAAAKKNGLP